MTDHASSTRRKSTKAVVLQRVAEILVVRIDGAQFHEIREYAGKMGWHVSDSMLRKYIRKADDLLREQHERKASRRKALVLARMEGLYARAVQAADYRTALACLEAQAKLEGLYEESRGLERQVRELVKRLDAAAPTAGTTADERLPPAFEAAAG